MWMVSKHVGQAAFAFEISELAYIYCALNGQDDVKTENPEGTAQLAFVTFIVQSYFVTLLSYAGTFCEAVVLKVMDQTTLVKRR